MNSLQVPYVCVTVLPYHALRGVFPREVPLLLRPLASLSVRSLLRRWLTRLMQLWWRNEEEICFLAIIEARSGQTVRVLLFTNKMQEPSRREDTLSVKLHVSS